MSHYAEGRKRSIMFLEHGHTDMLQIHALPAEFIPGFETKNVQNYPHALHLEISSIEIEKLSVSNIAENYHRRFSLEIKLSDFFETNF